MKINYHIHTSYSGDLIREDMLGETPEKYVLAAKKLGFDEICFTEHLVIGYPRSAPNYSHSMMPEKLGRYIREVRLLAKSSPGIKIRAGVEIDWLPEKLAEIRQVLSNQDLDCVLGSVHHVDGEKVEHEGEKSREAYWKRLSPDEIYRRHAAYYRLLSDMAKSKICDVVSHLDLMSRDGYLPEKNIRPLIADTVDVIAKAGLCVEVNTAGLRKALKAMHPDLDVLKLCRQKGIPVTIGTDAHRVSEIDFHLEDGMQLIKDAGYTTISVFENRKRLELKI